MATKFKVGDDVEVIGGYMGSAITRREPRLGQVFRVLAERRAELWDGSQMLTLKGLEEEWSSTRFALAGTVSTPLTINACLLALCLADVIEMDELFGIGTAEMSGTDEWLRAEARNGLATLAAKEGR